MIKFFRKIRQQLFSENKFSKYLIYAIGEIFLVVIGILIALQINTWNQDRITLEKEQIYLKSLKNEFENNLQILETEIKRNQENRNAAIQIANQIDDPNPKFTSQQLSQLIASSFAYDVEYKPSSAVLNELVSSGSMKDISNDSLKIKLAEWESMLGKIKGQERILITDRVKVLNKVSQNTSMRAVFDDTGISEDFLNLKKGKREFDNLSLLKSRDFENDLLLFIATNTSTGRQAYRQAKIEIEQIIQLLENELK